MAPRASASKEALTADMFRHPVDIRATRLLRSLFGIELVLRQVLSMAEEVFYLENLSNAVLVSEKQLPDIHELVMDSCRILCVDQAPQVYVRNNPQPNAYTLAFKGKRPFIVLHSSLVDLMTPEELKGVIAHELGHLKCEHGVWVTMANLVVLFAQSLGGDMFSQVTDALGRQVQNWLRAAELSCDRAGLLVVRDRQVMFSILMKLSGGVGRGRTLDVNEYLKQIDMFEEATKSPFGRLMRRGMTEALTHPLPILRVKELNAYADSAEFKTLVRRSQASS
ncbi:Protease HtpX-like 2 [Porphyridium purpureum]|uniref:Protease HtpX-like 2 n=1 Tax=Porphyridium purpureum TaxID=35688 RepID=A0A5J4YT82_PORPP|nr:Protease HtpX-like 2 [Porphyridium purpureum]|eukprot:POR8950..scf229_5